MLSESPLRLRQGMLQTNRQGLRRTKTLPRMLRKELLQKGVLQKKMLRKELLQKGVLQKMRACCVLHMRVRLGRRTGQADKVTGIKPGY